MELLMMMRSAGEARDSSLAFFVFRLHLVARLAPVTVAGGAVDPELRTEVC